MCMCVCVCETIYTLFQYCHLDVALIYVRCVPMFCFIQCVCSICLPSVCVSVYRI